MIKWDLFPECKDDSTFENQGNMLTNERGNYLIISVDVERSFDKIQHSFIIKTQKSKCKVNYPNIIKAIPEKPTLNIILHGERLKAFAVRSRTRQFKASPSK
jgi:hypothetical protein